MKMKQSAFRALLETLATQVGLEVASIAIGKDAPFGVLPVVDVFVKDTPKAFEQGERLAVLLTKAIGSEARFGWYSAEIGYSDVPAGQGMIELDAFVLTLEPDEPVQAAA